MNKLVLMLLLSCALLAPACLLAQSEVKSATYTITQVHQYNIEVVRIAGRQLTVNVEGFGRRRFQVPRDFTFDIDGEKLTLNQLRSGQKLRAYVTEVETGELMLLQDEKSTDGVLQDAETDETDVTFESDDTAAKPADEDDSH